MGEFFYRLGISLLGIGVKLHALINAKSKKFVEGRKDLFPQLEGKFKSVNQPVVWFHCASLGEFEQGRPLIEAFKKEHPNFFILLTFFSPSGYEVRKNYELADYICYMPLDTAENAERFVKITQPKLAFFVKYEFWHYHLKALSEADCWLYSVSAIFRSNQRFFKFHGGFYRKILKQFDHIFVQNKTVAALLKGINLHNVSVSGDTRFDRVKSITDSVKPQEMFVEFSKDQPVLIGGSTWEPDIKAIAPFLQQNPEWKAIIAPHDISEANLKLHEEVLKIPTSRFSTINSEAITKTRVILIDNIGMLSSLYQYGKIAFIGGAFGDGLHNTLEAACFGLPVFFGNKNYGKFQEALDLLDVNAAFKVANAQEFLSIMNSDDFKIEESSQRALDYVNQNIGAKDKIMKHIAPIIQKMKLS
ncbi:glycosyltransferase N-terminal domain-containing protein [Marivirga salinae]|uniref:3-deoxy-D-manno-octulosonic acid transferase n=1 Tax=Marivirga salinarum TaxID=3059078 RepID=A0AA51NAC3_9BACT|nr:glycosyltransferase N-terminal domain-containing protein [Marivirga sp. BDSF4-3]WMN11751.1 glycosyltransferase N-terminal domain-containing protein [Marivirga sp. BDSF4-3]